VSDGQDVARAIDAIRRGWPITIDRLSVLAIESADDASLARFDEGRRADLLISGQRASTLKLLNQRDADPAGPVRISRPDWIDLARAVAVADPALDLQEPWKGPFKVLPAEPLDASLAAVRLCRLAGLLPALFVSDSDSDSATSVSASAILAAEEAIDLRIASRARLPTEASGDAQIVAFRSCGDSAEHIALVIGENDGAPPLVRIHSECLTGDALGSLKCDCGPQLRDALASIAGAGWGILLYLRQEGRGIGLINKLRAYALQDQGFDTVDANLRLGFADDERSFGIAAAMLRLLGQDKVRLLTNNPQKAEGLTAAGVNVVERVPLAILANSHNRAYLATKRDRSGHQL
jgi:GTP cyclohydrolase II